MNRRDFLSAGAATTAAAALPFRLALGVPSNGAPPPRPAARAFDLVRVRLRPGPYFDAMDVNRRFLLAQDPDRLLHMFRVTAGLPSTAEPLGGWEAPTNELRGHYSGHYMSACALMWASLGDGEIKARGDRMVAGLAACQQPNGYVSAFPEEFFDRLRAGRRVWAPFYTLHKIMAGLLDMHQLAANGQALDVLQKLAQWTGHWVQPLGDLEMQRVLETEYGGMNEVLYNLSAATGNAYYAWVAHHFDHRRIFDPLAEARDELKGLHVNTTIPKIIGAARRYELLGEPRYRHIAEYFWREVTSERAYCTGGTSNGESWNSDPGILSTELSGYTQEDCTTYNMLKLTRHIFEWTADPACADYYERALWNGILGSQDPADGEKLYYVSLASGYWKLFGTPFHDYWCCTGTMSESFSKFGDSIYFHDDEGLYVNLFVASELDWRERGIRVVQDTRFPNDEQVTLTIRAVRPTAFALRVRVPYWATGANEASLNGRTLDGFAAPGGYYVVRRTWHDGDRVVLKLPMALHVQAMPDDASMQAVMYGPLVLVGKLGTDGLTADTLRAPPTKPRTVPEYPLEPVPAPSFMVTDPAPGTWIEPTGAPLEFRTTGGQPRNVTLVPFYRLFGERYGVYWKIASAADAGRTG
ncbi:MAG TPA: beta-L-arabinofuranosidase domain-containing protein [Gemmatimonadales bacterium]|nr:beta-L-arabinofuranosidase domain-containing protein [Gemmatimonadales bacterium]